jgi:hypothetical protein
MAGANPTRKQQKVFALLSADVSKSTAQAMREAGYSASTSRQPQRLTKSPLFIDLARKYLPDKKLLDVATKGLDATKVIRYKGQEYTDPDYYARHQYLETALRIRNLIQSDDVPLGDVTINVINYADAQPIADASKPVIDIKQVDGGQVADLA